MFGGGGRFLHQQQMMNPGFCGRHVPNPHVYAKMALKGMQLVNPNLVSFDPFYSPSKLLNYSERRPLNLEVKDKKEIIEMGDMNELVEGGELFSSILCDENTSMLELNRDGNNGHGGRGVIDEVKTDGGLQEDPIILDVPTGELEEEEEESTYTGTRTETLSVFYEDGESNDEKNLKRKFEELEGIPNGHKLPASKSPIMEAMSYCAIRKWGIEIEECKDETEDSNACVIFRVIDFEKYYRYSSEICSKQNPTEDIGSRVKSLRRWLLTFQKKKIEKRTPNFRSK